MTVSAGATPRSRTPAVRTRPDAKGARSGAALRAYERRQQRKSVHEADVSRPGSSGSASGTSIAARIPFVALIIGMLALGMGVTLLLTTKAATDSYSLSEAKSVNQDLVQQRASLQRDVELADSAPELARKAAELGMVPASNVARLLVGVDGAVAVVGTPAPADGKPVAPLDPDRAPSSSTSTPQNSTPQNSTPQNSTPSGSAASRPRAQASPAAATVPAASVPAASVPAATPRTVAPGAPAPIATPNTANGAESRALGEQLVPMTLPSDTAPVDGQ